MKIKKSITVEEERANYITKLGNGNFSKGLDILLDLHENNKQCIQEIEEVTELFNTDNSVSPSKLMHEISYNIKYTGKNTHRIISSSTQHNKK